MSGGITSIKVAFRVPRELKKCMERFSYVNWSEVVIKAIEEKVREEEVKFAFKVMDDIAAKAKPGKLTSELIGEFRGSRK